MKSKPTFYVSLVTGNKYPWGVWCNFGSNPGGPVVIKGTTYYDLPKEEYPYTLEYEDDKKK